MNISSIANRSFSPINSLVLIGTVTTGSSEARLQSSTAHLLPLNPRQPLSVVALSPKFSQMGLSMLIIDPDGDVRHTCCQVAMGMGFEAFAAADVESARTLLEHVVVDVVLVDAAVLLNHDGSLLRDMRVANSHAAFIMMSGSPSVEGAISAMHAGARHYLAKPFALAQLIEALSYSAERPLLEIERKRIQDQLCSHAAMGALIGQSSEIKCVFRWIARAAIADYPVLISGQFGAGKQLVAQLIHQHGHYRDHPFISLDCGATSTEEMENILFGEESMSGLRPGLMNSGQAGCVLLDEIAELSLHTQARLLRVLENRSKHETGSASSAQLHQIRLLATSSCDLESCVKTGRFRKDLLLRLNMVNIRVPALNERVQDIALIAAFLLNQISQTTGQLFTFSFELLQTLVRYNWPGNLRELNAALEYACALGSLPVLGVADLPKYILLACEQKPRSADEPVSDLHQSEDVISTLEVLERQAILTTLQFCKGDKLETSKRLGIGKTTLYRKLKEYNFD